MFTERDNVKYERRGRYGIVTITRPKVLNALDKVGYLDLNEALMEAANDPNTIGTILTGQGKYFSAGANVTATASRGGDDNSVERRQNLKNFVSNNVEIARTFYTHPKMLVAALNGPAVGLSAALLAHCDLLYAVPNSFLLLPFANLGLVTEGTSSQALARRVGYSKAYEMLLLSRRTPVSELKGTLINEIYDVPAEQLLDKVISHLEAYQANLEPASITAMKELINLQTVRSNDEATLAEALVGVRRFESGLAQRRFELLASGKIKHKL
ncbi:hypothetical protein CANCADRAFT_106749 [Tortispora caseinolytica NRRL Y-17796]|uniref:Uncharacterized protein n=1 Tax=Tortispora caseinolytica NRRL Y-17796 TaxID=767744 RepID=A0A1E4TFH8_9ASCO|nr:hypothetical protein CANCADRAFT_106749 [Tortispora caseinolytica NRRL Y-17796]